MKKSNRSKELPNSKVIARTRASKGKKHKNNKLCKASGLRDGIPSSVFEPTKLIDKIHLKHRSRSELAYLLDYTRVKINDFKDKK